MVVLWAGLAGAIPAAAGQPAVVKGLDSERVKAIAGFLPVEPAGLGVPADDRAAWEELAARKPFQNVVATAAGLLKKPIPQLSDELYLDFSKTGNRRRWEAVAGQRSNRLFYFVLAECLEDKGRFIGAWEADVRALCAEPTWVMPAHDRTLANFKGDQVDIDLRSSRIAAELATADYLLGERLSPEIRELIRRNVHRRVLDPYRDMITGARERNYWVTCTNNWNAVCHAGVVGAALWFIRPREERALFAAAAEKHIGRFLAGFGDDGYCSEGVGYWNYGFGHFIMLAEMVHQATGGKVDLLEARRARPAALYGSNIEILDGLCPPFADCTVNARPSSVWMWYINRRFGLRDNRWEQTDLRVPQWGLVPTAMFSFRNSMSSISAADATDRGLPPRAWFESSGILVCRPGERGACRLGAALKGGHNAEHHNHNDVGSYVVALGGEMLLADPGAEVYTERTFSARRYESQLLNSFGHPVPVVAGQLQRPGPKARGQVLRADFTEVADTLVLDMCSAYDVPELRKLQRTFVYSREAAGQLTVTDEVAFETPQRFETALVTLSAWEQLGPRALRIQEADQAIEVKIEVTGGPFSIKPERIEGQIRTSKTPTRLGIELEQEVREARVSVFVTPAKPSPRRAGG